jgi:hypothetical protein
MLEADVPQCAVVELVEAQNGGATAEMRRDPFTPFAESPGKSSGSPRARKPDDGQKRYEHV